MNNTGRLTLVAALATTLGMGLLPACSGGDDLGSEELIGADETVASTTEGVSGSIAVGTKLKSTTNVNLRTGPSTSYSILHVVPSGSEVSVVTAEPKNGWYKIKHNGTTGWSSGQYYTKVTSGGGGGTLSAGREEALKRGKSVVGFSYWWGGGAWLAEGPSSSTKGSCSGSCPSCSHSGKYGADCSGFIGKAWRVNGATGALSKNEHPVSTATLVGSSSQWSTVSRGSVKPADAMVYNTNGAGHVIMYNSGDGWGSMYATECKGCSAGCVYGLRTASSAYKAIRRTGF
ncbi:MAG: SH3 domain-containing protein [Polyangiaceae bacterium]|nr:SH3 domain-containing protein [Polyangiaceae bacterium]